MANIKRENGERHQGISLTLPTWLIDEIDAISGKAGRSQTVEMYLVESMTRAGNQKVIERRLHDLDVLTAGLDEERERLKSQIAEISTDTKKLDDPLVVQAIKVIAERASNYQRNDGEPMGDKAIRTMAEKYLKTPMPNGFIEKVRENIS